MLKTIKNLVCSWQWYPVRIRENTDQNSSKYGHFSRSVHIVQMSLNSLAMTLGILVIL